MLIRHIKYTDLSKTPEHIQNISNISKHGKGMSFCDTNRMVRHSSRGCGFHSLSIQRNSMYRRSIDNISKYHGSISEHEPNKIIKRRQINGKK